MPPKPPTALPPPSQAGPQIRITYLSEGQEVWCFHRYCQDPNGNFFMVDHKSMGSLHPSMGKTDGWTTGTVAADWGKAGYDAGSQETWPLIRYEFGLSLRSVSLFRLL